MHADTSLRIVEVVRLGVIDYAEALSLQADLVQRRRRGEIPDRLLLLEHPHVITLGTSASAEHVLLPEPERRLVGVDVFEAGRGGDVTYHGPGQLVGYPVLALEPERRDLHRYVRDLEEVVIRALRTLSLDASRKRGLTGVWLNDEKVCAIGVRVSSGWITSHGFALNVATDLSFFDAIVPCGIEEYGVTSIERRLGREVAMTRVEEAIEVSFAEVFERRAVPSHA